MGAFRAFGWTRPVGVVAVVGWILTTAPRVVAGAPTEPNTERVKEVERLSAAAHEHYKAKEFSKAISSYLKAYHLGRAGRALRNGRAGHVRRRAAAGPGS